MRLDELTPRRKLSVFKQTNNEGATMKNEIEVKNVAILEGNGDLVDGAEVLAAIAAGVTKFVEA